MNAPKILWRQLILCWRSPAINTNFGFLKKLEAPKILWRQHFVLTVTSHQHKICFFWKKWMPQKILWRQFILCWRSPAINTNFGFLKKLEAPKFLWRQHFVLTVTSHQHKICFFFWKNECPKNFVTTVNWTSLQTYKHFFSSSTGSIACDDCPMGCNHVIFCSPCVNMTIESLDFIFFWVCANL